MLTRFNELCATILVPNRHTIGQTHAAFPKFTSPPFAETQYSNDVSAIEVLDVFFRKDKLTTEEFTEQLNAINALIYENGMHTVIRQPNHELIFFRIYQNRDFDCFEHPEMFKGEPIGMYHCPCCGTMVIGGVDHGAIEPGMGFEPSKERVAYYVEQGTTFEDVMVEAFSDAYHTMADVVEGDIPDFGASAENPV